MSIHCSTETSDDSLNCTPIRKVQTLRFPVLPSPSGMHQSALSHWQIDSRMLNKRTDNRKDMRTSIAGDITGLQKVLSKYLIGIMMFHRVVQDGNLSGRYTPYPWQSTVPGGIC